MMQTPPLTRFAWHPVTKSQRGYVLLAVLWLIAALSLMVASMIQDVRLEVRQAALAKRSLEANALGTAAIRLVVSGMVGDAKKLPTGILRKPVTVFGSVVGIEIVPLNGLIDLNNASPALLADMFRFGGEVPADPAADLAAKVVAYREAKDTLGRPRKFHGVEDLLRVGGVDHALYAKLEKSLTTSISGSGLVNALAAPETVLAILAKGDLTRARQLVFARLSSPESLDTSTLTAAHIENVPTTYLEIRALGPEVDQMAYAVVWQVDLGVPAYGLPWQTISTKSYPMRVGPEPSQ